MRPLFVVLVWMWVTALPAAAWLSRPSATPPEALLAHTVYTAGAVLCHQRPERSFVLAGSPLPVCARCTGIYAGAAVAALGFAFRRRRLMSAPSPADVRVVLAASVAPMLLTLGFEWTTGVVPAGVVRALSGLPVGIAVAWTVLAASRDLGHSG